MIGWLWRYRAPVGPERGASHRGCEVLMSGCPGPHSTVTHCGTELGMWGVENEGTRQSGILRPCVLQALGRWVLGWRYFSHDCFLVWAHCIAKMA